MLRIGSLFSGAGALDLAVGRVFGGDTVWHCESDAAASKVLTHHWPKVPNLGDITRVDWTQVEPVDVLCAGFPCTDVSAAGKRAGMHGTRSGLWSYMRDAIDVLRPEFVVIENVRGLLNADANRPLEPETAAVGDGDAKPVLKAVGAVLGDLADIGVYDARWVTVPASAVGAPHRRERVFILATNTKSAEWGGPQQQHLGAAAIGASKPRKRLGQGAFSEEPASDTTRDGRDEWRPEPARRGDASVTLLPTPTASDGTGGGQHPDKRVGHSMQLIDYVLLCTPADGDGGHRTRSGDRKDELLLPGQAQEMATGWGRYEPAIRRWESITRPAPPPTELNRNGNPRLNPEFSSWLMGWPAGWVTQVPGISHNDQLRIIGNGVCVLQCVAALNYLKGVM